MHRHIRQWKWVAIALYCALIGCLIALGRQLPKDGPFGSGTFSVILLLITFGSQWLFLTGAGTVDLCRPIRKRRLLVPILISATMLTLLLAGVGLVLADLTEPNMDWFIPLFWASLVINWVVWIVIFFHQYRGVARFDAVKGILSSLLIGSLATLLISIPSHIISLKRGGCLAGLFTMVSICSGLFVMLWSFGPAIVLLFLYEKRLKELERQQREAARTAATSGENV